MSSLRFLLILALCLSALVCEAETDPAAPDAIPDTATTVSLTPSEDNQTTNVSVTIPQASNVAPDERPASAKRGTGPDQMTGSTRKRPAPTPPWEPDQYQRFVEAATGQRLPHFGHDLFDYPASAFAPLEDVPVPADYVIGPGDELLIRLWGSVEMNTQVKVDRNGLIRLSRIGTFSVAGIRADEIESRLRDRVGHLFKNFSLSVSLGQLRSMQIYVMGQAQRPGAYVVSSLSTLVSALFASGGPNATGSLRHIKLLRHDQEVGELDLYALLNRGDKSADARLQPGDVIVIPNAGPRVVLLGAVHHPAIYELRQDGETIQQVLDYAGGKPITALSGTALLERITPEKGGKRGVERIDLSAGSDRFLLKNGDMLTLLPISMGIDNAVTLRGHVAMPIRRPFIAGMRVRDLIPEKEALLTAAYFQNKNALVGYRQGYMLAGDKADPPDEKVGAEEQPLRLTEEINWEYARIERLNPANLRTELIPFNLAKAILEDDPAHNLLLQPGDVVSVFSREDVQVPQARETHLVKLEGEVAVPGLYQAKPGETLRQLLVRVGGLTPDAYLYGARFFRESVRLDQEKRWKDNVDQLAAEIERTGARKVQDAADTSSVNSSALSLESQRRLVARLREMKPEGRITLQLPAESAKLADLPAIVLEDGDVFHVPATPAFVSVLGQVYSPGSFVHDPDNRVADYLAMAGGPTRQANDGDIYVVHANGTVSSSRARSWIDGGIDGQIPHPGDTVFVPEELDRFSWRRELKDWTSILYQFGLGAAALKSLN